MKITNFICGYKKTREQDHQEMDFEKDDFSSLSLDKELGSGERPTAVRYGLSRWQNV